MRKLLKMTHLAYATALIGAGMLWVSTAQAADLGLNEDGVMTVAANAIFPPIVSIDPDGTYVGFDVDVMEAIAKELGVKVNWVSIKFDGIIPGIAAKRFDVGVTGVTDTVEREQAVDFVNYATVGSGIMVQAGNPKNIHSLEDLCGKIVASQTGDLATRGRRRIRVKTGHTGISNGRGA